MAAIFEGGQIRPVILSKDPSSEGWIQLTLWF